MKKILILFAAIAVTFISCEEKDGDITPSEEIELIEVAKATESSLTITIMAEEELFVGYNTLRAKITDQNDNLVQGSLTATPMMQMTEMRHSAPTENAQTILENGEVEFAVVFVMPSGEMGSWTLDFNIDGMEVSVPVTVKSPEMARLVSFTSEMDESRYFVAYLDPMKPQVGENDLEVAIYKRESMMSWPAVTDLTLELEPWMVSMDHGSPNNVAPTHVENGHYEGKVNFTMTGDWQIRLTVKEDGEVCGNPYFDIYFQ